MDATAAWTAFHFHLVRPVHPTLPAWTHLCFSRDFKAAKQGRTQEPLLQVDINKQLDVLTFLLLLSIITSNMLVAASPALLV